MIQHECKKKKVKIQLFLSRGRAEMADVPSEHLQKLQMKIFESVNVGVRIYYMLNIYYLWPL